MHKNPFWYEDEPRMQLNFDFMIFNQLEKK